MGAPWLQPNDSLRPDPELAGQHQPGPAHVDSRLRCCCQVRCAIEIPKRDTQNRTAKWVRGHHIGKACVGSGVGNPRIRRPRCNIHRSSGGGIKPGSGVLKLHDRGYAQSEQHDYRCTQSKLEQRLTASQSHRANLSLPRTTWARSGRLPAAKTGTSAGTDPPTSTCNEDPRSVAQTQTPRGTGRASRGHQPEAPTPTRLVDIARSATRAATSTPAPATVPARAPASAASCAQLTSLSQTAICTAPSTSSKMIGHANANSISAVPRDQRFIANSSPAP